MICFPLVDFSVGLNRSTRTMFFMIIYIYALWVTLGHRMKINLSAVSYFSILLYGCADILHCISRSLDCNYGQPRGVLHQEFLTETIFLTW